jgi:hypothetical protein
LPEQAQETVSKDEQQQEQSGDAQPQPLFPYHDKSPAVSKIDLKTPSFIPVLPDEKHKTEPNVKDEEIDLLPSASATSVTVLSLEAAPEIPPHRESSSASASASVSVEADKKTKNGKPRSRNRHKR